MSAKQNNNISKLNFEHSIKELTAIVEKIEQGEIALQDSLAEYEKGILFLSIYVVLIFEKLIFAQKKGCKMISLS